MMVMFVNMHITNFINMSTLREQFDAYNKRPRVWLDSDGKEDWAFNFYDWFCKDTALENRAKKLMPTAKRFAKKMNIDLDTHYVFFKNNCPMNGPLRDDFRICDKETGDVVWTVTPNHQGRCEIWGSENNFNEPIFEGWNLNYFYHERGLTS